MASISEPAQPVSKECLPVASQGGVVTSGARLPIWLVNRQAKDFEFKRLEGSTEADVCVVGAGISGLSVAFELAREGKRVAVLDDGDVCSGETGRTTAHLGSALDDRWFDIIELHGLEKARLIYESHAYAIDRIESLCADEKIECEFTRLSAFLIPHYPKGHAKHSEAAAIIGKEIDAIKRMGNIPFKTHACAPIPGVDSGECIEFLNQAQFHPTRFCAALARALTTKFAHLVRIFTRTHANTVQGGQDAKVTVDGGGAVHCAAVVIATNIPFNNKLAIVDRLEYFRTYVIGARMASQLPQSQPPHLPQPHAHRTDVESKKERRDILVWDTADPYHYVRWTKAPDKAAGEGKDSDVIIVGGEDHDVGYTADGDGPFKRLEEWTRARWPIGQVAWAWSGHIQEPVDDISYTGRNLGDHDNVYVHTGDSGDGLTHGVMAGRLLADLIVGKPNRWAEVYAPQRGIVDKGAYAKHVAEVQTNYAEWLKGGQFNDIEDIPPCTGAILKRGEGSLLNPVAVYKDGDGKVFEFSAVCPHLKGVVKWNAVERSFDCPVHGSRFDCKLGAVLTGPANCGLQPVAIKSA